VAICFTWAALITSFVHGAELGRFAKLTKQTVIEGGSYPRMPTGPWGEPADLVGVEPPLGVSVEDMPVVGEAHEVEASLEKLNASQLGSSTGDAADAAPGPAASSSFNKLTRRV